ncbi:hypothetical protein U1Q18_022731, partial [Sarracenia purpurea var. burkii]
MTEETRSQEIKTMEESIRGLKENGEELWPSREQSEEEEWPSVARGEASMPGNLWDSSGDQRAMGSSMPPPRHWRTKAKRARVRGRTVRRRRSLKANELGDNGGDGRRE